MVKWQNLYGYQQVISNGLIIEFIKQTKKGVINYPITFPQVAIPYLSIDYTPINSNASTSNDYHYVHETTLSSCKLQIAWESTYINVLIIGYQ